MGGERQNEALEEDLLLNLAHKWLLRRWWGLLITYGIATGVAYAAIRAAIEPLDVPSEFPTLWPLLSKRSKYHVAIALFLGANIALLLELIVKRTQWNVWLATGSTPPRQDTLDKQGIGNAGNVPLHCGDLMRWLLTCEATAQLAAPPCRARCTWCSVILRTSA